MLDNTTNKILYIWMLMTRQCKWRIEWCGQAMRSVLSLKSGRFCMFDNSCLQTTFQCWRDRGPMEQDNDVIWHRQFDNGGHCPHIDRYMRSVQESREDLVSPVKDVSHLLPSHSRLPASDCPSGSVSLWPHVKIRPHSFYKQSYCVRWFDSVTSCKNPASQFVQRKLLH